MASVNARGAPPHDAKPTLTLGATARAAAGHGADHAASPHACRKDTALQEHATRFHGGGRRAQERDGLWISALLQAGRTVEARARFERFERLYPDSPRLDQFREALASP